MTLNLHSREFYCPMNLNAFVLLLSRDNSAITKSKDKNFHMKSLFLEIFEDFWEIKNF